MIVEQPLVSVVMATYNDKPSYIHEAINSLINQSYENFEILILDDSNEIETIEAIDSYTDDHRIHIIRDNHKLGFVPSLNKGLQLSKGKYIARMDGDDVASLDRFEKQVAYLEANKDTDILGGQMNVIDENGVATGSRSYPLGGIKLIAFFTVRSPVAHPSVMFRRTVVDAGYKYDETLPKAEDLDFWIRLYNAGYKFNNLPDTLVNFRVESDFIEKRVVDHAQEDYVLKVRRDNFSWKRPFFSTADYLMSYVRKITPDSLKAKRYEQENGNRSEELK